MPRIVVVFYFAAALFLAGFGFAGVTAGAVVPVTMGAVGMLGFLGATAARIGSQQPPAGRAWSRAGATR